MLQINTKLQNIILALSLIKPQLSNNNRLLKSQVLNKFYERIKCMLVMFVLCSWLAFLNQVLQ